MEKEFINGQMGGFIGVSGNKTKCMEWGKLNGVTVDNLMEYC